MSDLCACTPNTFVDLQSRNNPQNLHIIDLRSSKKYLLATLHRRVHIRYTAPLLIKLLPGNPIGRTCARGSTFIK
jgi:hypothetical protein